MTVDREAFLKANDPDAWMRTQPGPEPKIRLWGPAPQPRPVDHAAQAREGLRLQIRTALSTALGAYRENADIQLANPIAKARSVAGATMTVNYQTLEGGTSKRSWTGPVLEHVEADHRAFCDGQAAHIRTLAARALLGGAITTDHHAAIIRAVDDVASAAPAPVINVQPATVAAPDVTVNVRPVLDLSGDEEIVRDHAGKVIGKRRVAKLEG